jgi:hypothetical protein
MNHDWGPEAVATRITSLAEFDRVCGPTNDDDRFAVEGAFTGDGTAGGKASAVYVYRMPLSGNAAASLVLTNTTPVAALTLTAKYKGTFGNSIKISTRVHPTDATKRQLLVYVGTQLVETWNYATTNITNLGAQINSTSTGSVYVVASAITSGVALTTITSSTLASGTSGAPITLDYTTAMSAVEGVPFNMITFPNLTDVTILAAARTWITSLNANTRRAFLVTGGGSSDAVSDAITRSALSSTVPDIVNAGGSNLVNDADTTIVKSTAQFTGFFAGIMAGYGVRRAMTFGRIPGWSLQTRPNDDNVKAALVGGVLLCTMDDDGLRIEKQLTTYTDATNALLPYAVFSKILSVRVMHLIDTDLARLTVQFWIGIVKSNPTTRAAYVGVLTDYLKGLEKADVLSPGQNAVILDPGQDNDGDTWYPVYTIELQQAVERVLAVAVVS